VKLACAGLPGTGSEVVTFDGEAALDAWLELDSTRRAPSDSVAFWVPRRETPTRDDADRRVAFLAEHGPSSYAFSPFDVRARFSIAPTTLDDPEVQLLIAQLNADLLRRYPEPGALVFSLHPSDLEERVGALLLAARDGDPVGCGAFKVIDARTGTAEIKRMYVVNSARGDKIGAALLDQLETRARALGVRRLVLELGPRQPEAVRRYERAGYAVCEPWGEFIGKDLSICMAKAA
jgi:putative acetyltransferase